MGISVVGGSTGSASKTLKVARFTTPGLSTFTLPDGYDGSNPLVADVTIVGGGGASGTGTWNSFSSSTYACIPGAGGGGAVWKGTVELTQNMNVHVGRGGWSNTMSVDGYYPWHGGNGGTSYISTGTPKNWFLNPQLLHGGNLDTANLLPMPFSNFNPQSQSQAKFSGCVARFSTNYNGGNTASSPIAIMPSTNYCWSTYLYDDGAGATCTLSLYWYTSAGVYISATTRNDNVYTNSGSSANQVYVGGTSPANAAYVVLHYYTGYGSRNHYFSNMRLETGVTSPTTYVDGNTSDYFYAGPAAGAITFSTSDDTYFAAGGGGGAAPRTNLSSTEYGGNIVGIHGYAGGCSGGGAFLSSGQSMSGSYLAAGGHGGGAGGDAISTTRDTPGEFGASLATPGLNPNCTQGAGTRGRGWYDAGGNWYTNFAEIGKGGLPLDGFGKGGTSRAQLGGPWASVSRTPWNYSESSSDAASLFVEVNRILGGRDNTGDGADSALIYNGGNYYGGGYSGGSGLVIIKYWE